MIIKQSRILIHSLICVVFLLTTCIFTACGIKTADTPPGTETPAQMQTPGTETPAQMQTPGSEKPVQMQTPAVPSQVKPGTKPDKPGKPPQEELRDTEEPYEQDTSAERILAQLPYYGNRNDCRMTAMQALAYAEAIRTADPWTDAEWFYPALMDVAGDGVPLLFLLWQGEYNLGYFLYGYENGSSHRIDCYDTLTVVLMDGEILLRDFMDESTYEDCDLIGFFRVSNGTAELVSDTLFRSQIVDYDADKSEYLYYINGDEVSRADYDRRYHELMPPESEIETLIGVRHTAYYPCGSFSELLSIEYSRDQAVQIFINYADCVR